MHLVSLSAPPHRASIVEHIQIAAARDSPAAFVQYAFRHEENNAPIINAAHHIAWHEFLDANSRAILFAPVEHAKTQHIAIGRVLWQLGTHPNSRIAIVSNTAEPHALKILSSIRSHIETNPVCTRSSPSSGRGTKSGDTWGQYRITVERKTIAKDPSVQSLGIYGPMNGSRLGGIILDDLLNFENTRTPAQIEKLCSWLDSRFSRGSRRTAGCRNNGSRSSPSRVAWTRSVVSSASGDAYISSDMVAVNRVSVVACLGVAY